MIELQTVTTKAKNPSTNEFQDVTWGGINVMSTSGTTNYNNLTNKPTINGVTVQGSLTTGDLLITAADVGALPSGTKYGADFALSIDSQTFVVTAQLKDQDGNNLGQAKTIDLPLETMVVGGSYDDTTQKIILTLKNGQTVEFSVADLVSGLQSEITLNNKLDADLVSDVSSENKFVTAAEKATWNAKANASEVYTKGQTDSAIETAIGALDVSSVGGSGKYISAISETNGKISATAETMDTVPTNGSTKAVTSGGVQAPLAEVVNAGAKNLVQIMQDSLSIYNIVFSVNKLEGTITITGTGSTSSAYKAFRFFGDPDNTGWSYGIPIPKGTYVLSGLPSGASQTGVRYILGVTPSQSDTRTTTQIWDGDYVFTISNDTTRIDLSAYVPAGQDLSTPYVFKPMICSKSQWDVSHQFEPYALSNPVITPALIEQVDNGAKNLFDYDVLGPNTSNIGTSVVVNGVRFTMNSDKSVTITRESSSSQSAYVWFRNSDGSVAYVTDFCDDVHVFSGAAGGSVSTYILYIYNINGSGTYKYFSDGGIIGTPQVTPNAVGISIAASYSPSNLVIKPMICTKTAWDVSHSYQPYAKTNPELTVENASQQSEINYAVNTGVKNLFDINATPVAYHTTYTLTGGVLSGTSNGDWASYNVLVNLPAGDYIFSAVISNFSRDSGAGEGTIRIRITNSVSGGTTIGTTNITGNGAISIPFSWGGGQFYTQYSFNFSSTGSYVNSFTVSSNMIRPAFITDSTFQPYALSNPVLTPAAIKAVDEGAKNLSSVSSGIISNSGGGFPIPSTPITVPIGTYIVSFKFSGNATRGSVQFRSGSTTIDSLAFDMAPLVSVQIEITSDTIDNFNLYSNSTATISEFMICALADWKVSQKYVPYALTNPELTAKLTADEADITSVKHMVDPRSQSQVSGGNLDNVTVSEMRVYSSPSGLPTGVSASSVCIVETCVVDSNSAYQIITLLSNQGTAQDRSYPTYKRVKVGGVWYDWKLIVS